MRRPSTDHLIGVVLGLMLLVVITVGILLVFTNQEQTATLKNQEHAQETVHRILDRLDAFIDAYCRDPAHDEVCRYLP